MYKVISASIMFWEYTQSGLLTDVLMVGLTLKEASKLKRFRAKRFMIIFRPTNVVAIATYI